MSSYAFRDINRTDLVLAVNLEAEKNLINIGERFFCPSPSCGATMTFHKSHCGDYGFRRACFSALPTQGHEEGCIYTSKDMYSPDKFNESNFDLKNFVKSLSIEEEKSKSGGGTGGTLSEVKKRSLSRLKDVYLICKYYYWRERINRVRIGDILFDPRSEEIYTKGIFGEKIVEAIKPLHFYEKQYKILLKIQTSTYSYALILEFEKENKDMFWRIEDKIYKLKENSIIVVAGNWSRVASNTFKTKIKNSKQIYIPRN